MNESLENIHHDLQDACEKLLEQRYTKKYLYEGMKITASELNLFLADGLPSDNLLQKVASHPLINLEVIKSYKLIEGKQ